METDADISTHLFYGLFVTTSSLYIAAKAFKKVQGPLLAIQLILLRQASSTLQTTTQKDKSNSSLVNLPSEVWNRIKTELVGRELIRAESNLISPFLCRNCSYRCRDGCGIEDGCYQRVRQTEWAAYSRIHCDVCMWIFYEANLWYTELPEIKEFLANFHLESLSYGVSEDDYDMNPLSAISAKKHSHSIHDPEVSTPFNTITSLSSSTFDLPFSINFISRQFETIRRVYGVKVVNYRKPILKFRIPTDTPYEEVLKQQKEIKLMEVSTEPSWQMWTCARV